VPKFGKRSKKRLNTCAVPLQKLFKEVVKEFDCSVIIGYRGRTDQDKAFNSGHSKVKWPDGKHNRNPSYAVDVAPYPINWKDKERFIYFAGYVKGVAYSMGISIRWGGDWDNDTKLSDNKFNDLVHFEIRKESMIE
jgi:peptidoglycan L-alanyl-D-glutamate endopeptidase CwlK|tara:strand:+ start:263 stop:670 length:408 start_codon:yes stop_codon:yes gene_type:complete